MKHSLTIIYLSAMSLLLTFHIQVKCLSSLLLFSLVLKIYVWKWKRHWKMACVFSIFYVKINFYEYTGLFNVDHVETIAVPISWAALLYQHGFQLHKR